MQLDDKQLNYLRAVHCVNLYSSKLGESNLFQSVMWSGIPK